MPEPAPEDNFGPVRKNSASSDGHVAETKELINLVAAFEETVMKKLDEVMRKVEAVDARMTLMDGRVRVLESAVSSFLSAHVSY